MQKFPEIFGPYFENIQSSFLYKNNIKFVFLEISFQCDHFVFLSSLQMDLKII